MRLDQPVLNVGADLFDVSASLRWPKLSGESIPLRLDATTGDLIADDAWVQARAPRAFLDAVAQVIRTANAGCVELGLITREVRFPMTKRSVSQAAHDQVRDLWDEHLGPKAWWEVD